MPLFSVEQNRVHKIGVTGFTNEKRLQSLIEQNLDEIFNCRFVATEYPTGAAHGGRIDTLALSEDRNPVIIEYKVVESSDLINQSLFYLSWIHDHRGDFEIAVQKRLGKDASVDWSDVRVICIAPGYRKYDLHAVKMMGANIELWRYRLYSNSSLHLEEVFRQEERVEITESRTKNPVMVAAGKKAAISRATGHYTFEQHIEGKPLSIVNLALMVQEFILSLDPAVEQVPKKNYVGYRISENIACLEVQKRKLLLFLKLQPSDIVNPPANYRDVTNIGHFGTGNAEFTIDSEESLLITKSFIEQSYRRVGG